MADDRIIRNGSPRKVPHQPPTVEREEPLRAQVSRKGANAPRTLWADDKGNPWWSYGHGLDVPLAGPVAPAQAAVVTKVIQQQGGTTGSGATGATGPSGSAGPVGPPGPFRELPVQAYYPGTLGNLYGALFRYIVTQEDALTSIDGYLRNADNANITLVEVIHTDAPSEYGRPPTNAVQIGVLEFAQGFHQATVVCDPPLPLAIGDVITVSIQQAEWIAEGLTVILHGSEG